jgi:formate dehydrogenase iron-sulfur subunit
MSNGYLIDTTNCVGCRACQTACKQWKDLPAEQTLFNRATGNFQNPNTLSAKTLTVVQYHELEDDRAPGGLRYISAKRQCMHCEEPACVAACPVTAIHKTAEGAVAYDASKCVGCRYCMWACPWGVPTAEWDSLAPKISKCDMCTERLSFAPPAEFNGQPLPADEAKQHAALNSLPACVKTCPAGALKFGERKALLEEAKERIRTHPGKYVDHIYGEHEAGGTNVLYLASVPFERLGFPTVESDPLPRFSKVALGVVSPGVIGVGSVLAGTYALQKRKAAVAKEAAEAKATALAAKALAQAAQEAATEVKPAAPVAEAHDAHPHFEPLQKKLWTPVNLGLAAMMAVAGLSFLARFALGLGATTNLSDTWAWGLWISFDLIWIAVAAGAFATAGLIYVLQRKDLYSVGRSAVLMGLLSYTFVVVTLVADLGLPWHFYQFGLQAPEHSAMFEVAWCVGLYVTILLLEFLPVPFERWGLGKAAELWRRYAPVYVVGALTLFVWLLSRKPLLAGAALLVFGTIAWMLRQPKGRKPEPIMLAIAAVTFSTMHQSSLGSLMLLMPDKLNHLWWSPVIPLLFLLSAIPAGLGLVILVEMWIAKAWHRTLRTAQLASLGQITLWALLVSTVVRLADVAVRGELLTLGSNPKSALFLTEVVLGCLVPLALLSRRALRERPAVLGVAAFLTTGGVVLNRLSAVAFALTLKGPMPQTAGASYSPSVVEWGIALGLVSATIFLFGLGVRLMPVLPAEERAG